MRRLAIALLFAWSAGAVSNAVIIRDLSGSTQAARPFTISRIFAQGKIANFAQPLIDGVPAAAWQDDVKTHWPDGSVQHVLVSFTADVPANGSITVAFANSTNACHLGDLPTCQAAALGQSDMLGFNGSGWGASFQVSANPQGATSTANVSARTLLGNGNWSYWLQGPVATQVIVEDATTARSADFGWKEKHTVVANRILSTDMTITVQDGTDLAALATPFTIEATDPGTSEHISISGVSGNTLTVAARGVDGTTAATHSNNTGAVFVYSQPLTWLTSALTASALSATVADGSGISPGDILSIDGEHLMVCQVSGNTLTFGAAAIPCTSGDSTGRKYDQTVDQYDSFVKTHQVGAFVTEAAAADRWSDPASDRYKSLHPMFVLTFYAGYSGVREEFVLENDWMDRAQDQYYDVTLLNGPGETNPVWSATNVKQVPATRWRKATVSSSSSALCGTGLDPCLLPIWDGTAPGAVNIDYNLPYMVSAGTVPYDTSIAINQAALDVELKYAQYTQVGYVPDWPESNQCGPDTAGPGGYLNKPTDKQYSSPAIQSSVNYTGSDGMLIRDYTAPGGRGELGLFTRWQATYLYAMGNTSLAQAPKMFEVMTGMGECAGKSPMHFRESDNTRLFCAKGTSASDSTSSCSAPNNTVPAFGRVESLDARPTATTTPYSYQNIAVPSDVPPTPVGNWGMNGYNEDGAYGPIGHNPPLTWLPYVITGDYYYLQELQHWASFALANASQVPTSGANPTMQAMNVVRHADWGYLGPSDGIRGTAWGLREVGYAALMSPDGTPEKEYFTKKLDTNIAIQEGKYNVTDGAFYNNCGAPYDCSYWMFGRLYKGMNSPNPLHFENIPSIYMGTGWSTFLDPTRSYFYSQGFMQRYLQLVLGQLERVGFPEVRRLRQTVVSNLVHQVKDPAVLNPAVVQNYMVPNTPCKPEGAPATPDCSAQTFSPGDPNLWFQDWGNWYNAIAPSAKTATALTATDFISGYAVLSRAAASFGTDIVENGVSGSAAWEWLNVNLPNQQSFATTPMWAFRPRPALQMKITNGSRQALVTGSCSTGETVRVAAGTGPFSPDDSADAPAAMAGGGFRLLLRDLTPLSTYSYRVTCGTTFRAGTFTTTPDGGDPAVLRLQLAPPGRLAVDHAIVEYGSSTALGQSSAPVACGAGCTVPVNGNRGEALYYRVSLRNAQDGLITAGSTEVVLPE